MRWQSGDTAGQRGERVAFGFLLVAVLAVLAAGVMGASRVRAAAPAQAAATNLDDRLDGHMAVGVDQGLTSGADLSGAATERCDALRAEGLRVTLADAASASFCVVEDPNLDATYVQLLNVAAPDSFAQRKAQAAGALTAAGMDVCKVTLWWVRRDAVRARVPVTDQYASPSECAPRVVSHDPAAALWQDFATRTVADALARAEREFGVRPTMPLTVHLHGTRDAYVRHVTANQPSESVRAHLAESEGVMARGTIDGAWIVLDASRFSPQWPERAAFTIRHEVTHYVQTLIAGCACAYPLWFAEGMADYSAASALGPITTRHLTARSLARTGRTVPLRQMEDANAADLTGVYDRGYATVSYLAERWGADALGQLVRRNQNGDPPIFEKALTALTGMTLDELDSAVDRWLVAAVPEGESAGQMRVRFATTYAPRDPASGKVEGEGSVFGRADGQVDVVAVWDCAPGAHQVTARWYGPDGTLARIETAGDGDVRCSYLTHSRLPLSPGVLATPGQWRVELLADGQPALALSITIAP